MKELTLIRHATAAWGEPSSSDFERPLSPEGLAEAQALGRRLHAEGLRPERIIASPARRTEQTAAALVEAFGLGPELWLRNESIYEASLETLRKLCQKLEPSLDRVILVGHNPGFYDLAHALSPEAPHRFPPAGAVHLRFDLEQWPQLEGPAACSLRVFLPARH